MGNRENNMTKSIVGNIAGSLVLAFILVGCGGGSAGASGNKQQIDTKEDDKKTLASDKNGKVKTIKLSGSAEGVAVSKDTMFAAVGEKGIEVHKIGYNDELSSDYVTTISGINARSISLSADGKKLHVINEEGFVNVFDISNVSSPIKIKTTTQSKIKKETISKDGNYKFLPKGKEGVDIYDISNPSNSELINRFDKSNAFDVVLTDRDTKALLAAGKSGITLLDIADIHNPNLTASFTVAGNIKGISLNEEEGLLFVANGDSGVIVYNLNVMLDKLSRVK
jgi:hypothetical protein